MGKDARKDLKTKYRNPAIITKVDGQETDDRLFLNLGCGYKHREGFVNIDKYDICNPDLVWDLDVFPYPFDSNSVDGIDIWHTLEHVNDWWGVIVECTRILKPGAKMNVRVPDESSGTALTYRDHNHVFTEYSFHGILDRSGWGTNAWAEIENDTVPLLMIHYGKIPYAQYEWMLRWPFKRLLKFCADHLRNFIWEQTFLFEKVGDRNE